VSSKNDPSRIQIFLFPIWYFVYPSGINNNYASLLSRIYSATTPHVTLDVCDGSEDADLLHEASESVQILIVRKRIHVLYVYVQSPLNNCDP
jgi:hypothetical protein